MGTAVVTTSPLVCHYTLEEFWALPNPPGGGHYELIAGVLYMVPPPSSARDTAVSRLIMRLAAYLLKYPDVAELFVPRAAIWIAEGTYLEPDLMVVRRRQEVSGRAGYRRSADLAIEVLSASTAVYDRQTKADTYAALGVLELWLVDLARHEIEQRILEAGAWRVVATARPGETLRGHVLPGLERNVAEIFEGLQRD